MVIEAFLHALGNFLTPNLWLFMVIGIIIGLIVGIIPTTGSLMAMAIIFPFLFAMDAEQALPLLVAIGTVIYTGGCMTSILLGVPGTVPNAATVIDGYPMTQKGEGGRAVGAGLTASAVGGALTAFLSLLLIPIILPFVMTIRSNEMVFLVFMGISFIAVLSGGSMIKGFISGLLGLLFSLVGFQQTTAIARFTFDSVYLYDGITLVAFAMGIFAIPEMVGLAVKGGTIAQEGPIVVGMRSIFQGIKDVFRNKILVLQSSAVGFIVGVIPGIGALVSTFLSYGVAKKRSKHPELFGTGVVEGVIAPECANNAKEGGALLTTLALGIPGSADMVLILAAMMLVGLIPGPEMLTDHLDLSLTLMLVVIVANIVAVIVSLPLAANLVKIAKVPNRILAPLIVLIVVVATFAYEQEFYDVITLLIFGIVGIILKRYGFNRPTMVLGFVLGEMFEKYLFISLALDGPTFFVRPISLILIFIIIALLVYEPLKKLWRNWRRGSRKT